MKFASSTGYVRLNWVGGGETLGRGFYNDQITYTLPASSIVTSNNITIRSVDKNGVTPRGRMISLELDASPYIFSLNTLSGNKIEKIEANINPIQAFNTRNTPNLKYFHANFCSLKGNINDYLVDSVTEYDLNINMLSGDINATSNKRYLYLNGMPINKIPLNIKDYQTISISNTFTDQIYVTGGDNLEYCFFDNLYNLKSATIANNPILTDAGIENSYLEAYYPWINYPTPVYANGVWYAPGIPGTYYFKSLTSINVFDNPALANFRLGTVIVKPATTGYSVTISGCPALHYIVIDNSGTYSSETGYMAMDSLNIIKAAGGPPLSDEMPGTVLFVVEQPSLRTVNISSLDELAELELTYCPFVTSLRVNPTSLIQLNIDNNSIRGNLDDVFTTSIPSSALFHIRADYNYFTSFTPNSSLVNFRAKYNQFSKLNFSNSKRLCNLDVSYNTKLTSLEFAPDHNNSVDNINPSPMTIDIRNTRLSSFSLSANIVDTIYTYNSHLTSMRIVTNMRPAIGSDTRTVPTTVTMGGGAVYPVIITPKLSSVFISGRFNYYQSLNYNFAGIDINTSRMDLRQVTISSSNVMPVETSPYVNAYNPTYIMNMDYALLHTKQSEFENFVFAFSAAPGGSIHTVYPQMNLSFNYHGLTSFIGSRCLQGLNMPKNVNLILSNGKIKTVDVTNPCYYSKLDFFSNPITDKNINLSCLSSLSTFLIGDLSGRPAPCASSKSPILNASNLTLPLSSITFPVDNRIEELNIINTKLSSINLAPFKNLKRLSLAWNRDLKTFGITNLSACSALRYFNITGCGFSSSQLTQIWSQLPTIPLGYVWDSPNTRYGSDAEGLYYNYNGQENTSTVGDSCGTRPTYQGGDYGDTQIWVAKRWRSNYLYQLSSNWIGYEYWNPIYAKYY